MNFKVENGCFSYNKREILNNISFEINHSQVLAILGSNGVGKTTLLKCMMGLLPWKKGNTFINNEKLSGMKHTDIWRKIAYVPQSKGTALSYTALEMVLMGRSARLGVFSQPAKEDIEIALEAMEQVGILWLKDKKCSNMSGGELQMVLIARALSAKPELLVLDEPESNLDFKNQLIILETISRLSKENGIGAIVNTHYPAHALKISDKALILHRDGTSNYGESKIVINEKSMAKAFSVDVKISEFRYEDICYKNVIPIKVIS